MAELKTRKRGEGRILGSSKLASARPKFNPGASFVNLCALPYKRAFLSNCLNRIHSTSNYILSDTVTMINFLKPPTHHLNLQAFPGGVQERVQGSITM